MTDMHTSSAAAATATFAGGCFWCLEKAFRGLDGVLAVVSGYTGGHTENPDYESVCQGDTGHAEAVQLRYDPARISYEQVLETFWHNIDPLDGGGQFVDRGSKYRSAIFWHTETQREAALASKKMLQQSAPFAGKTLHTAIEQAGLFYPAEDYHQGFAQKNILRYQSYAQGSGRAPRLAALWGKK